MRLDNKRVGPPKNEHLASIPPFPLVLSSVFPRVCPAISPTSDLWGQGSSLCCWQQLADPAAGQEPKPPGGGGAIATELLSRVGFEPSFLVVAARVLLSPHVISYGLSLALLHRDK